MKYATPFPEFNGEPRVYRYSVVGRYSAVQVVTRIECASLRRLKVTYDEPPSNFALNFNLRCYSVVAKYPHDSGAFTQGLVGRLIENKHSTDDVELIPSPLY